MPRGRGAHGRSEGGWGAHVQQFSNAQVGQKVLQRSGQVPGYAAMIMACSVKSSLNSIAFNVGCAPWQELVQLVKQHEASVQDTSVEHVWLHPNGILEEERGARWMQSLGVVEEDDIVQPSTSLLYNQRVIRLDCDRTRQDLPLFRNERFRSRLETVLTRYCLQHAINYKQGLNYIAAPILSLQLSSPVVELRMLDVVVRKFLPIIFSDDEFGGLQSIFKLFRLLLQYHDPELCAHLEKHEMTPELYASPWFITMLANRMDMHVLLHLWDCLILHQGSVQANILHIFMWLALLLWNRYDLINHSVMLPEKLNHITMDSIALVDILFIRAKHLILETPESMLDLIGILFESDSLPVDSCLFAKINSRETIPVSCQETIQLAFPTLLDKRYTFPELKFTSISRQVRVLDCRTFDEFASGHIPGSKHIDPMLFQDPDCAPEQLIDFNYFHGYHLLFLHDGATQPSFMNHIRSLFAKKGFPWIGTCDGGFRSIHLYLADHGKLSLLKEHDPHSCKECSEPPLVPQQDNGFFDDEVIMVETSRKTHFVDEFALCPDAIHPVLVSHPAELGILYEMVHTQPHDGSEAIVEQARKRYEHILFQSIFELPPFCRLVEHKHILQRSIQEARRTLAPGLLFLSRQDLSTLYHAMEPLVPLLVPCKDRRISIQNELDFDQDSVKAYRSLHTPEKDLKTLLRAKHLCILVFEPSIDWASCTFLSEVLLHLSRMLTPAPHQSLCICLVSMTHVEECVYRLSDRFSSLLPNLHIVPGLRKPFSFSQPKTYWHAL